MALLSVNETTTFRWSFEEDLERYAAAGIPAIGVWRQKLSDYSEERVIELVSQKGLRVAHLSWIGGFTGSDGRSYAASVEDGKDAIQMASRLKAGCLVAYSGARGGHTYNHAKRLVRDALRDLAPLAAELGVTLALEPMHPGCAAEFTFLTSIDDVLAMLAAIDRPQVKMVLDTYHVGQSEGLLERIPALVEHIALVQLGDLKRAPQGEQNRCRLGEGVVPLKQIVAALAQAGYDGFYDVELLGEEIESMDYPALLEHAKEAFWELVGPTQPNPAG